MAMTACKECKHEISSTAKACPKCGAKMPRTKWWLWVPLGLITAFLGYGAMLSSTPEGRARSEARSIINFCWDEAKRSLMNPIATNACRELENRYTAKFGSRP